MKRMEADEKSVGKTSIVFTAERPILYYTTPVGIDGMNKRGNDVKTRNAYRAVKNNDRYSLDGCFILYDNYFRSTACST